MTYFPDLSPHRYFAYDADGINIGWLDGEHDYPVGGVTEDFLDRLWVFCRYPVIRWRGFHYCEICPKTENEGLTEVKRNNEILHLGDADIRVFGSDDKLYCAPNLIFHYVIEHSYHPPEEFIQAVIFGPLPGTEKYKALAKDRKWKIYDAIKPGSGS